MNDSTATLVSREELQLATRNHGMLLEALRYPVTPVGLHYLLTHYDVPLIDADRWRLRVRGSVRQELELSISDLRARPAVTRAVTMECAGNGRALMEPRPASQPWLVEAVGTGEWTGVELASLLEQAGLEPSALEVLFSGADRGVENDVEQAYQRSLGIDDALSAGALLAYDLNGAPLPPQHGFPLRLVVPGWYGMGNVKWLETIDLIDEPFRGHQQITSYRLRQDPTEVGEPLTRMLPRSLLVPPGIPDFFSRVRHVPAGAHIIGGRAWSGAAPVVSVEVSTDGGTTWDQAALDDGQGVAGRWTGWRFEWDAAPGEHELCCRCSDAAGEVQPLQPVWNHGGYANNAVHRVPVVVR